VEIRKSSAYRLILMLFAWLTLRSRIWRRYVPPKRRAVSELYGVATHKIIFFIATAVRTSNPAKTKSELIPLAIA
jgi:hypothetical protein